MTFVTTRTTRLYPQAAGRLKRMSADSHQFTYFTMMNTSKDERGMSWVKRQKFSNASTK